MKQLTEKIKLVTPSLEMKNRAMALRAEFLAHNEKVYGSSGLHHYDNFEHWLADIKTQSVNPPPDRLAADTYFAMRVSDGALVGCTNIRRYLTEAAYHNGHIGYSVRPSERRKGYGREILRQALIKAEQTGILSPVVTCNKTNTASKRVIESNSLRFERAFTEQDGNIILIYAKEY